LLALHVDDMIDIIDIIDIINLTHFPTQQRLLFIHTWLLGL